MLVPATLLKKSPEKVFFCEFWKTFEEHLFFKLPGAPTVAASVNEQTIELPITCSSYSKLSKQMPK